MNNYCECNELKDELNCTNNNKESIDLILNELTIDIKSIDLSFNELNNIDNINNIKSIDSLLLFVHFNSSFNSLHSQ